MVWMNIKKRSDTLADEDDATPISVGLYQVFEVRRRQDVFQALGFPQPFCDVHQRQILVAKECFVSPHDC